MKRFAIASVLAAGALAATLSGCNFNGGSLAGTCDANGNCTGTLHANSPSAHAPKNTPPVASTPAEQPTSTPTTAAPDVTVTETATPSVTPTVVVYVGSCDVTRELQDVAALETSQDARDALMTCMGVTLPDPQLNNWLIEHAIDAGGNLQDRQNWEQHQLADAYHQYG